MTDYDILWNFLREFFNYEHYRAGIENARTSIEKNSVYQTNWQRITQAIAAQKFAPGEALTLVNEGANQMLDENSDAEAYVWLGKMVQNIERTDGVIEEY